MPANGPQTFHSVIAGAGGGLVASIATCPLDVVKTRLQNQRAALGTPGYKGVVGTVQSILVHDGVRGLYRGLGPTILGYLPTWAIYFAVYDGIKTYFGEQPLGSASRTRPAATSLKFFPAAQPKGYQPIMREHPWGLHILSAMTAGAASTICTNPLWVIKTRVMTQHRSELRYRHTLDAFLTIYRTEGPQAFYRGLFTSLLGISHVAVQFPLYEELRRLAQDASANPSAPLSSNVILLCSATAKMTASIVTYPHEVVRTRLQTQRRTILGVAQSDGYTKPPPPRIGLVQTVRDIVRHESWRGLYKGLSVNLFRTVPNSAVTMLTYELLMRHLSEKHSASR